jgi:4-aminobutyrate aminotransferase
MRGLELVHPGGDPPVPNPEAASALMEACRQRGLLIGKGGLYGNVLRIAPPLSVTEAEVAEAVDTITTALADLHP